MDGTKECVTACGVNSYDTKSADFFWSTALFALGESNYSAVAEIAKKEERRGETAPFRHIDAAATA